MPQFDLHRYQGRTGRARYVVDIQCDFLEQLATRLVVPVYPVTAGLPLTRLNPIIEIDGRPHFLAVQEMAAIEKGALGEVLRSTADRRDEIIAAVDFLITGF